MTDKVDTEVVDNGNDLLNLQRVGENDGISKRISQSDDATQDDKACGLRQYLQLRGQTWKATRVVTPAPSTFIWCLLSPIRTAVFIY